ncbi:MAG: folylpolyglutamate synthase/dihydrofolate synthase family protein, partial [Acidimicrobiia bacterium]
ARVGGPLFFGMSLPRSPYSLVVNYESAIDYLERHIDLGMKPGLSRMIELLEMMGHPESGYPIVHVAGTNGKTSTSRLITVILSAHGLNTGTFTSPHLERIEERIGVNGRTSTPEEFAQAVSDVAGFADLFQERTGDSASYFELTAAMAFAWFSENSVDAAVVEVGLGGRLDATNAADAEVAVVTGIDFDHTEVLGTTIEQIASEKFGIVKPGSMLVTGAMPEEATRIARATASELGATHYEFDKDFRIEGSDRGVGGWLVSISGTRGDYEDLFLPLRGRHQIANLAVAVTAAEALLGGPLDEDALRSGAAAVTSPGRLELVASSPLVLIDGAHNAQGMRALAASLAEEFANQRWVLVISAMKDKDLTQMVPQLKAAVRSAIATEIGSSRSLLADDLAAILASALEVPVESLPDPAAALARARELAGPEGAVLVTGSLYLVGAIRGLLMSGKAAHRNER